MGGDVDWDVERGVDVRVPFDWRLENILRMIE